MSARHLIVGGGLAGASAAEAIRERDPDAQVTVLGREPDPPYARPPLSKDLWFGKTTPDQVPLHPPEFWRERRIELVTGRTATALDPARHEVRDDAGGRWPYDRVLLATGGRPRRLAIPGGETVLAYRTRADWADLVRRLEGGSRRAVVVGGGFIGMELAAALAHAGHAVTLVFPEAAPLARVLPADLAAFVGRYYAERGVTVRAGDTLVAVEDRGRVAVTRQGARLPADVVLAGVGIDPETALAQAAGLTLGNGIAVDEYARASAPDVFAAGDVAEFPCVPLGRRLRIEHFDHAQHHGAAAGANMAGAATRYDHLPFFWSDLFDLGWEAVGEVDAQLATEATWREPHREGIVFYLRDRRIRGALLWNVWGLVDRVRALIAQGAALTPAVAEELLAPQA
ncbi:MAG TPA: FAD/NAD(P)-binding oxidoreductase [Candidatus Eisenbacteria bacterium]|nr:FAD/NAD(P)-binding oxidoreductase [Candidatus Eisenbacteria bacterium]